jgi:adenine C2-methylase RlmN of 23S rRNA A2503 and tRNA A37
MDRKLSPLPLFDEDQLLADFRELGVKESHAHSIWRHITHNGATSIEDVPNIPKSVHALVNQKYALTTSTVVNCSNSSDGSTTKLLIRLQDGHLVESVIMRYGCVHLSSFPENIKTNDGFRSKQRATLCVSSQIGCAMGCTFCATGTMGLLGNLWAGEILEQLYHANKVEPIRNVVFMGKNTIDFSYTH